MWLLCVLFHHGAGKGAAYDGETSFSTFRTRKQMSRCMIEMFAVARTGGGTKWKEQLADELHKPVKRKFRRRRVIANGVDDIWSADLVDMQWSSRENKGFKYLLNVIDVLGNMLAVFLSRIRRENR